MIRASLWLCYAPFDMNLWHETLIWNIDMKLWYGIWYEPLWYVYALTLQSDTRAKICFLVRKVTWPCHWCTNGMTLVWLSDVPHRPHFDMIMSSLYVYDLAIICFGGRMDASLIWFVSRDLIWLELCLVNDVGCNPRLHNSGS